MERLTRMAAPALVSIFGVGRDMASTLFFSAGGKPQRIHSDAAFASLWRGVRYRTPPARPTGTGRTGGGQANAALYRVFWSALVMTSGTGST